MDIARTNYKNAKEEAEKTTKTKVIDGKEQEITKTAAETKEDEDRLEETKKKFEETAFIEYSKVLNPLDAEDNRKD
ncbi:hypothetical protein KKH82_08800 [Patescibacteria group bacterium]|nr:hypothetical protein [Patescibacteria group bacterium]